MMPLIEINYDIYTLVVIQLPETLTGSQYFTRDCEYGVNEQCYVSGLMSPISTTVNST